MPLYSFYCEKCDNEFEEIVSPDIKEWGCPDCGEISKRKLSFPNIGKEKYQMSAIMPNGERVKGHFGKMADKK